MTLDEAWEYIDEMDYPDPYVVNAIRQFAEVGVLEGFLGWFCAGVAASHAKTPTERLLVESVKTFQLQRKVWSVDPYAGTESFYANQPILRALLADCIEAATNTFWRSNPEYKLMVKELRQQIVTHYGPAWLAYMEGSITILDLRLCTGKPIDELVDQERRLRKRARGWWGGVQRELG